MQIARYENAYMKGCCHSYVRIVIVIVAQSITHAYSSRVVKSLKSPCSKLTKLPICILNSFQNFITGFIFLLSLICRYMIYTVIVSFLSYVFQNFYTNILDYMLYQMMLLITKHRYWKLVKITIIIILNPYYNLRNCKASVASISLLIKPATVTKRPISLTIKLITSHTNKAHMSRNESISISGYQKDDSRLC